MVTARIAPPVAATTRHSCSLYPWQVGSGLPTEGPLIGLDLLDYHQQRLVQKEHDTWLAVHKLLSAANVSPRFAALDATSGEPAVGVEVHRFRNGGAELVALLSNPQLRVNELGPPEFRSNERFEKPRRITLTLPHPMYLTDVRTGKSYGRVKQLPLETNPYEPSLFLASDAPSPHMLVSAPQRAQRGSIASVGLSFEGGSPLAEHVFHVDVVDPSGKVVDYYTKNLLAPSAASEFLLPLAANDVTGAWQLHVKDVATAQTTTSTVEVY